MTVLTRLGRLAPGPKQFLERRRKQLSELWRPVHPLIRKVLPMMPEEFQVEFEPPIRKQPHNLSHSTGERGAAIGRKPHHFVLVSIMRKAEILGQRLIKGPKRVWKIYSVVYRYFSVRRHAPGCAREIAETVDGDNGRLVKR